MRTLLSLLLIVRLVMLLRTPAFAAPAHAQNLTLHHEGTHLYLSAKGKRLAIRDRAETLDTSVTNMFTLSSGDTVLLCSQAFSYPPQPKTAVVFIRPKAGQTTDISLDATLKQWLPDDSKWGGHTFGNYLRGVYNHEGLSVSLENPVLFQGALLAVFTTRSVGGSGNVIKSQQLVRVQTAPPPGLQMLQCLDVPDGYAYAMPSYIPRLFVWGKRLLLFPTPVAPDEAASIMKSKVVPQSEMHEIGTAGNTLRSVGHFPSPLYPVGIIADRWLALAIPHNSTAHPVWLCDLTTQRSIPLAGKWQPESLPYSLRLPPPGSAMPCMALYDDLVTLIHLPDGRRTVLQSTPKQGDVLFWNGLAVIVDYMEHRVTAYNVRTGRRVKSLVWTEPSARKERHAG